MTRGPGLPPLLLRLVARLLPPGHREEVLGDLEAGHRRRRERLGRLRAGLWLLRECAGLLRWRLLNTLDGTTTMGRDFLQDLRFGLRTLLRRPGFTFTAVLVLALGIGAPTTVFTLVDGIFFWRPAHVEAPPELVRLYRAWAPGEGGALEHADYTYYRETASTLEGLAAWGGRESVAWSVDGAPGDQLEVGFVSDNYFQLLGATPARGRAFLPEENATPGTDPVAVLSHGFWRRALAGDPEVVGTTLTLNDRPYTVVGVAPEGFAGLSPVEPPPDAWLPLAMYGALTGVSHSAWWERLPNLRSRWLQAVGRRADGVTFEAARAELTALGESLEYENKEEGEGVLVERGFLYRPSQQATLDTLARVLLAAVAFVLAVAAANVAVLLLSRAATRTQEMGIRTAMGAGRGRLARQLLAETLLLSMAGGTLGVGLAWLLSDLAGSLLPFTFATEFRPDAGILLAALASSALTAVAVGLLPALHAARTDVRSAMQKGGAARRGSGGPARSALVVGQVALSVILVAGALLFGRSFQAAWSQEVGFDTEDRLVVQVDLQSHGYTPVEGRVFVARALEELSALPGVEAAATTRQLPFRGDWTSEFPAPPGATPNLGEDLVFTGMNVVSGDYFRVMGIPMVQGRALGEEDTEGAPAAVVVNETLARQLWLDGSAVGRTLPVSEETSPIVVGVARDATYYELGEAAHPQLWGAEQQLYQPRVHFLLHTRGPAPAMAGPVHDALRELDPGLAFGETTTLEAIFEEQTARYRVSAVLVSLFGAVALLLAAAGLYGVVAFLVARRTREIGVRMALGAPRGRVARSVMGTGLRLAALGTLLGMAGALALRGFTASLLYGVSPTDPLPLVGAAACLLAVSVLAALAPARRATRVDPMEAIRAE